MPKKSFPITSFSGLNTETDPRDLKPGELSVASDISLNSPGRIKLAGSATYYNSVTQAITNPVEPGYGLFHFSSDYDWTATPLDARTNYLAIQDGASFYIVEDYDGTMAIKTADTAGGSLSIGATDSHVKPCYYYVDGALRICDGEFANTANLRHWLGYIKRTHFDGITPGGSADAYADWFIKDAPISAPTTGLAGMLRIASADGDATSTSLTESGFFTDFDADTIEDKQVAVNIDEGLAVDITTRSDPDTVITDALSGGSDDDKWSTDEVYIFPSAGLGFNISADGFGSGGGITVGEYEFASSFIYENEQESLLYNMDGSVTIGAEELLGVNVMCTSPFNPRIIGGRIYIRIKDSSDDWILLLDISMENGARQNLGAEYKPWQLLTFSGTNVYCMVNNDVTAPNLVISELGTTTYEMMSSLSSEEESIDAKYKTACIVNRRAYIGNIYQDGIHYGDRMIKSPVNKFDTFPASSFVDVAINDGDDIISLIAYADRILQFKREKLYIVNVSQDYEYLESTHMNKGIDYPCQVMAIENGVVWCNSIGVFFYDGQQIHELSQLISTDYKTFASTAGAILGIGYNAELGTLYVVQSLDGLSSLASGNTYVFEFKTKTWSFVNDMLSNTADADKSTNFVLGVDGKPFIFEYDADGDDKLYTIGTTSKSTSEMDIQTGDLDFGNIGIRKRLYGVRITYKSATTSNVKARVYYNGDPATVVNLYSGNVLPTSSPWEILYLEPAAKTDFYSLRLDIYASGTVASTFEINDITFIYREKGVR